LTLQSTTSYWVSTSARQGVPPFSKDEFAVTSVKKNSYFIDCRRWNAKDFQFDTTPSAQNNLFMDGLRGSNATIRND
jgi:hypothetical protein